MLQGFDETSATATCIFAYCAGKQQPVHLFVGKCEGDIVQPRGDNQFGWDPIFQPKGYSQTFAEMPLAIKNQISHRAQAVQKVTEYLETNPPDA